MDMSQFFRCSSCDLMVSYNNKGQSSPDFKENLLLLEEAYMMKNPFKSNGFLIVGANCCICEEMVCVDPSCSIFYTKRFCKKCACMKIKSFPAVVQKDIKRLMG